MNRPLVISFNWAQPETYHLQSSCDKCMCVHIEGTWPTWMRAPWGPGRVLTPSASQSSPCLTPSRHVLCICCKLKLRLTSVTRKENLILPPSKAGIQIYSPGDAPTCTELPLSSPAFYPQVKLSWIPRKAEKWRLPLSLSFAKTESSLVSPPFEHTGPLRSATARQVSWTKHNRTWLSCHIQPLPN